MHSFRTMVMPGKDAAWYLVTSKDAKEWYATLQTFNFYQKGAPDKFLYLNKDLWHGWLCYSVTFNEIGMEQLRKLPDLNSICIELTSTIEQYLNWRSAQKLP